jgi:predicted NBD/HSP70 family sugar kinase
MAIIRAAEAAIAGKQATRLRRVEGPLGVAAIAAAAAQGDTVAKRILAHASEHLGRGISFLLNILNPEMIVLGGPVIEAGEPFLHAVRASVARHALLPRGVAIVPSTPADRAELTGSVLLAMESTVQSYRIVNSHDGRARTATEL